MSVSTGSMEPAIPAGSLVVVKNVPESSLQIGDVITYASMQDPNVTITHRIVSKDAASSGFVTKGDANNKDDGVVASTRIVGKVVTTAPLLGGIINFMRTIPGLLMMVYVPALILIGSELKQMIRGLVRIEEREKRLKNLSSVAWEKVDLLPKLQPMAAETEISMGGGILRYKRQLFAAVFSGLIGGLMVAYPALALLSDNADLTGNTISADLSDTDTHADSIVFRKIHFNEPPHATKEKHPTVILFNPTTEKINISGWTLHDNNGQAYTIGKHHHRHNIKRWIRANRSLPLKPKISDGLQFAGDRLILKNLEGETIDALSWNDDTTQMDPSIQDVYRKTILQRIKENGNYIDTDTAEDWQVKNPRYRH